MAASAPVLDGEGLAVDVLLDHCGLVLVGNIHQRCAHIATSRCNDVEDVRILLACEHADASGLHNPRFVGGDLGGSAPQDVRVLKRYRGDYRYLGRGKHIGDVKRAAETHFDNLPLDRTSLGPNQPEEQRREDPKRREIGSAPLGLSLDRRTDGFDPGSELLV